ncbi:putative NUDIX hydrolase domain-containing protein [Helianthus annuus]|uniref:NUDIX hydrolase domain-containing protein n=1 Tax=Helianthus annuus TaxID=4232 RepID=A0A251U3K3_HELAN|nr:nudix hydrolase 15, mitochondrial [Helianthus annuus]KAF5782201.1 putative NUDIX hydrolase domain-containing protein [Helianthus annuus]KAJ0509588.1 putative NUDIX hydrolase domain-containing protein [Helianthus annuus]KAJ0517626.1 putative NUDIX hydrolase domain-containing protein [Helianthus annuus]KAJ0638551.1 putative NUDIX hydrolase domain-containing protein [Helianthus annuus]KAJ0685639.1 putative NUDIX hydrolase domain-containing protein [Helianthus annuus]
MSKERLAALAQQLRMYKAPVAADDDDAMGQPSERLRPKKAAVLICLFEQDNNEGIRVILTKRSSGLSTHSGEVALPGGKAEEDDVDDADTATREAHEEIGLHPSLVDVVAFLQPFLSKHLLRVIPVIGILSDRDAFNPTPNAAEVDDVFDAPLEMFLKDEHRRSEKREWMGEEYLVHYFDYETPPAAEAGGGNKKYLIWGLTAGILIRAASLVYQRPPDFLDQTPKFKLPRVLSKGTIMP